MVTFFEKYYVDTVDQLTKQYYDEHHETLPFTSETPVLIARAVRMNGTAKLDLSNFIEFSPEDAVDDKAIRRADTFLHDVLKCAQVDPAGNMGWGLPIALGKGSWTKGFVDWFIEKVPGLN